MYSSIRLAWGLNLLVSRASAREQQSAAHSHAIENQRPRITTITERPAPYSCLYLIVEHGFMGSLALQCPRVDRPADDAEPAPRDSCGAADFHEFEAGFEVIHRKRLPPLVGTETAAFLRYQKLLLRTKSRQRRIHKVGATGTKWG